MIFMGTNKLLSLYIIIYSKSYKLRILIFNDKFEYMLYIVSKIFKIFSQNNLVLKYLYIDLNV